MSSQILKFAFGVIIASAFAVSTPAAAAAPASPDVQGTMVVADATALPSPRYSSEEVGVSVEPVAAPARLSALAGSDATAWDNVKSVGTIVRPKRKVH